MNESSGDIGRRKLPHEVPWWIPTQAYFFITLCCQPREENHLCHPPVAEVIFNAIQFYQDEHRWFCHLALCMPDHLHLLVSFKTPEEMKTTTRAWKRWTSRRGSIPWQRDFFDHRLRNQESSEEKNEYIRQNPVRKGLVTRAEDWTYVWNPKGRDVSTKRP
jgi:REP element-mobilizing transposase RayT